MATDNEEFRDRLFGDFRHWGYEVKWRMSSPGMMDSPAHFVVEWGNGNSLNMTGPKPSADQMLAAIRGYEQGYNYGLSIGKARLANELKRLLEIT